jgi:hypothetical protein
MRSLIFIGPVIAMCASCTTLDQSFRLGAASGALTGAAAMYAAGRVSGTTPPLQEVGTGASVGLALGLIVSYFVHQQVVSEREESSRQTDIYFGDLPPNPFIVPKTNSKKGAQ